jgi:hypothetical protein
MIPPELHAQIRRLFYAEPWRLNTESGKAPGGPDAAGCL